MERTNKQENNIGGERPPNSAACQFGVWLHEQVDDPTESQHHDKSQVIGNPYRKFVFSTVRLVGRQRDDLEGKQRDEDAQPDRLFKVQLLDVERGGGGPTPPPHVTIITNPWKRIATTRKKSSLTMLPALPLS